MHRGWSSRLVAARRKRGWSNRVGGGAVSGGGPVDPVQEWRKAKGRSVGDAAGVNVKVRAGVCVVAYTRVIDRGPLSSFLRFARGRATNCILANSILLGTLLYICMYVGIVHICVCAWYTYTRATRSYMCSWQEFCEGTSAVVISHARDAKYNSNF